MNTDKRGNVCPKCGSPADFLGGEPAHPDNRYCVDESGCGWRAWEDRGKARNFDKEQEAFEAWWDEKYTSHKLNRIQTLGGDTANDYRDPRVQLAFEAWLECARQKSAQ